MTDFIDISKRRITVRNFDNKKVEFDKIQKILEAGRWAPTAVNGQPQRILVLDSEESLNKVKEFCTFSYDKKYIDLAGECEDKENGCNNYYYGAPLVLFVCYDKDAGWKNPVNDRVSGPTDATIVATHMMLEAASIGLGTVWISYFDEEKAKELLNIPDNWQPVCMIYIGYPATDFVFNPVLSRKRLPLEKTCFFD